MSQRLINDAYEIMDLIGSGGMAMVYRARQVSLDRIVALKEMKPALALNPELRTRFEREAMTAASLQHENIIQVYNFTGEAQDQALFMIMEYVDGVDLRTVLKRSGPLPVPVARVVMRDMARALAYAHRRGLIHRDIKPGNVMLSKRGEIKLMDFGIVKALESDLTQTGAMLGTPSYMSPEQIMGENITPATDVFSLGVMAYEILTGMKPFQADDERSLSEKIRKEREYPPRSINPEIPRGLQRLIRKCLEKKAERRPRPEAIIRDLERMMRDRELMQAPDLISEFLQDSNALLREDPTTRLTGRDDQDDASPLVPLAGLKPQASSLKVEPVVSEVESAGKKSGSIKVSAQKTAGQKAGRKKAKEAPDSPSEIQLRTPAPKARKDEQPAEPETIPFPMKWLWWLLLLIIAVFSAVIIFILTKPR